MKPGGPLVLWLILLACAVRPLSAQSHRALLGEGIQAYRALEMDSASTLLRRSLGPDAAAGLDVEARKQALTYLGAVELYRDRRQAAVLAFRQLVNIDPVYRPDSLIFPPDVIGVFDEVSRATPAVAVSAPPRSTFGPGDPGLPLRLAANVRHAVLVTAETVLGEVLDTIYQGPVGDLLVVHWDAETRSLKRQAVGGVVVGVSSLDRRGQVLRRVDLPLQVTRGRAERLEPPTAPPLLPEQRGWGTAVGRLSVGLGLAAVSLLVLPQVTSDAAAVTTGVVLSAGAVFGFLEARPGRPLPENVVANEVARAQWRAQVDAIERVNRARGDGPAVTVEVGEPALRVSGR